MFLNHDSSRMLDSPVCRRRRCCNILDAGNFVAPRKTKDVCSPRSPRLSDFAPRSSTDFLNVASHSTHSLTHSLSNASTRKSRRRLRVYRYEVGAIIGQPANLFATAPASIRSFPLSGRARRARARTIARITLRARDRRSRNCALHVSSTASETRYRTRKSGRRRDTVAACEKLNRTELATSSKNRTRDYARRRRVAANSKFRRRRDARRQQSVFAKLRLAGHDRFREKRGSRRVRTERSVLRRRQAVCYRFVDGDDAYSASYRECDERARAASARACAT